jgi:hypothetical protein
MADVTISELTQGTPSNAALLLYSQGGNTLSVAPSALLQNAGNIGIGTTAPSQKLDIYGSGVVRGTMFIGDGSESSIRKVTASTSLYFRKQSGAIEMTLDSSGNLILPGTLTVSGLAVPKIAWARFDGSGVIQASSGITSITSSAITGYGNNIYKIDITAAGFSNANYSVTGMTRYNNYATFMSLFTGSGENTTYNPTSTYFYVGTYGDQGNGINTHTNYIQVIGN